MMIMISLRVIKAKVVGARSKSMGNTEGMYCGYIYRPVIQIAVVLIPSESHTGISFDEILV